MRGRSNDQRLLDKEMHLEASRPSVVHPGFLLISLAATNIMFMEKGIGRRPFSELEAKTLANPHSFITVTSKKIRTLSGSCSQVLVFWLSHICCLILTVPSHSLWDPIISSYLDPCLIFSRTMKWKQKHTPSIGGLSFISGVILKWPESSCSHLCWGTFHPYWSSGSSGGWNAALCLIFSYDVPHMGRCFKGFQN